MGEDAAAAHTYFWTADGCVKQKKNDRFIVNDFSAVARFSAALRIYSFYFRLKLRSYIIFNIFTD